MMHPLCFLGRHDWQLYYTSQFTDTKIKNLYRCARPSCHVNRGEIEEAR